MKYKCVNDKFYNKRSGYESDYSMHFTIGNVYDISEKNELNLFFIISDLRCLTITDEVINSMFISLSDFRDQKIKLLING